MERSSAYMLCALVLVFGTSVAGAADFTLDARGQSVAIGGATFYEFTPADQTSVSSGTGVIDPFLTIRKRGSEEGYNTDASPLPLDDTRPQWNHSLTFSQLLAGPAPFNNSFEFLLDINEPAGTPSGYVTLTDFRVFATDTLGGDYGGNLAGLVAGSELVYSLAGDTIRFDYNLWQGSGQNIDLGIYILQSLFAGLADTDNIYVYAKFGLPGEPSGDGFEEFIQRTGGTPVPEPETLILLGSSLLGLAGYGRRRLKKQPSDQRG